MWTEEKITCNTVKVLSDSGQKHLLPDASALEQAQTCTSQRLCYRIVEQIKYLTFDIGCHSTTAAFQSS